MSRWNKAVTLADSALLAAGTPATKDISDLRDPVVCVALENLGANADDTVTIEIVGAAGTYEVDSRTLNAAGSYTVTIPQATQVSLTSANGATYSAEVRANPR